MKRGSRQRRRIRLAWRAPAKRALALAARVAPVDVLALVGFGLLVYGVGLWWTPLAWIVAGVTFLAPLALRVVERVR